MKRHGRSLAALLFLVLASPTLLAQRGSLPSADMRIDPSGYQYIEATNPTGATYSLVISYTLKTADGKFLQETTNAYLRGGQTRSAFKCSLRPPHEQISDVKVIEMNKTQ